ncbi:hypothetical protein [Rhizobium lentis]|uniref:hypothetical protein n=1 Tax=Rhizobium lentis TaxID=1138194 RepID=UPI00287FB894|nr:hypothetical protein [Rhizobium lentis]
MRSELETELARAMLSGEVAEGAKVVARWDAMDDKVAFRVQPPAEADRQPAQEAKEPETAAGE